MNENTNIVNTLEKLKEKGYDEEFELLDNKLVCNGNLIKLSPNDINVKGVYHIEGPSELGDEAILYAISSHDEQIKGTFLHEFSNTKQVLSEEMIKVLNHSFQGEEKTIQQDNINVSLPKEKANLATELRPEGSRKLNSELIEFDLNASIKQIKEEQTYKDGDRNAITLFKSKTMRVVLIALHTGAEMKTHTAPGSISVQVLKGAISFNTAQKSSFLEEKQMITLQPNIPHSVIAEREAIFLLTLAISLGTK